MFPPQVIDVRLPDRGLFAAPQVAAQDPAPVSKAPGRGYARKAALAGAVAGICLGVFVKVGVFAHARPQYPAISAKALAGAPKTPWAVLTDIPAPPRVQDLGTIPMVVIAETPGETRRNPPPQGYKCHGEVMENGGGVRVCRPDSVAASPVPRRSLK